MDQRVTDEMRAGYIEAMGPEIAELFAATPSELTWVHRHSSWLYSP